MEDLSSSRFVLSVANFTKLDKKYYSPTFQLGGYNWRVLIYPKGNNVDYLSMYLDVADEAYLPHGWNIYARFCLAVVNQNHDEYTIRKDTQHKFNAEESDWGFTSYMPLTDLYDPVKRFLVDDTLTVEVSVASRYDSKLVTGYVGLKNDGQISYINSLLQTLYHIPYFRKAVYQMPIVEDHLPSRSITLALQSLFYNLQYSVTCVATKELTHCVGCNTHDVHELNRLLCEKLEEQMKGTVADGVMQQLFEGHQTTYIECINVNYSSTRKESFYDLQLDVKGCRDVYASFDKYVKVECLDGDNKYHTGENGLQDARKGVRFLNFPSVLQIQLKRFEYDSTRDTMVKINDRYEFPLDLDLDKESGKYLSPVADRRVRNLFTLHSVLVQSGGEHGGRCHSFIRPNLSNQWFKFDDEKVTREDTKRALEDQYGGEEEMNTGLHGTPFKLPKYSNAYMLVYVRKADVEKVICNTGEQDLAEHLRVRLKKEKEETEEKEKEAWLYTIIKVARDEDLVEQIGNDINFDLVDHDKVRYFRIHKDMPFSILKEEVAKEFGVPVEFQRFWLWAKRENFTFRPLRALTPKEETQTVGEFRGVSKKVKNAELKLFLEIEIGLDLHPVSPPEITKDDIIIFFKLYDPIKAELRYVGRLFVKSSALPSEILSKLNVMAGFPSSQNIELYEEIKFTPKVMCDPIDKKLTFQDNQLQNGDIVCFQKSPESGQQYLYPYVYSFLDYVHNRQVIHFRSLEKPKEDSFRLELSKLSIYDEVVGRVACKLGIYDPSRVRLITHDCSSQSPRPTHIMCGNMDKLSDILVDRKQGGYHILYYQVLEDKSESSSRVQKRPSTCVICLAAPTEGACIPCGHMACCMPCLSKINGKGWGCPVCRAPVEQIVKIFAV